MGKYRRSYGSGEVSSRALRRYFGSTSETGPLHVDDGGIRDVGAIGSRHIDDTRYNKPRRGSGFPNPERDWDGSKGFAGSNDLDRAGNRIMWTPGMGYTKQSDRPVRASVARARRSSSDEYWDSAWYGDPPRRQGG
jgi:hypothetical protein